MAASITNFSNIKDVKKLFSDTDYIYDPVPEGKITLYDLLNKSNEVLEAYKKIVARNIVLPFLKMSAKSLKNIGKEYKRNRNSTNSGSNPDQSGGGIFNSKSKINNLVKKTIKNTHKSNNINNVYITKKCEQSKLTRILCKGSNFLFKHREKIEMLEKGEHILELTGIPYLAKIYKMTIGFVKVSNKIFRLYMADMNYLDSANLDDPPTLRNVIKILNTTGVLTEPNIEIILKDIHKVHEKETLIYLIKNILHYFTAIHTSIEKLFDDCVALYFVNGCFFNENVAKFSEMQMLRNRKHINTELIILTNQIISTVRNNDKKSEIMSSILGFLKPIFKPNMSLNNNSYETVQKESFENFKFYISETNLTNTQDVNECLEMINQFIKLKLIQILRKPVDKLDIITMHQQIKENLKPIYSYYDETEKKYNIEIEKISNILKKDYLLEKCVKQPSATKNKAKTESVPAERIRETSF